MRQGNAVESEPSIDAGMTHAALAELIRARLDGGTRIGPHHAIVFQTIAELSAEAPDVHSIYRALLDSGNAMVMSKLYRVLKVLEQANVIERHWLVNEGRVRRIYALPGRPCGQPRQGGSVVGPRRTGG